MGHRFFVMESTEDGWAGLTMFDEGQTGRFIDHQDQLRRDGIPFKCGQLEMGECGCGPPIQIQGELLECLSAAGPDCACDCHELEAMADLGYVLVLG